ncbi:MAG: SRPBCC domain-containing protein [Pseudomonadota bacterium]
MTTRIEKSVHLAADAQTVWNHLTQPDLLRKWFHPSLEPLSVGEEFTLVSQKDGARMCFGRVVDMQPFDYMKWDFSVGPLNGKMTTVEWRITPTPGGVRLSLDHTGLPETDAAYSLVLALDKGWHGFMLSLRETSDGRANAP